MSANMSEAVSLNNDRVDEDLSDEPEGEENGEDEQIEIADQPKELDDDGEESESQNEEDLPYFVLEKMNNYKLISIVNETCRDPKRLMQCLEQFRSNMETITEAFTELSTIVKREGKLRPTFVEMHEDFDARFGEAIPDLVSANFSTAQRMSL